MTTISPSPSVPSARAATAASGRPRLRPPLIETTVAMTFLGVLSAVGLRRAPGLWFDDAFSAAMATAPWSVLRDAVATQEVNNAGFYVLLRAWVPFGQGDLWLRVPTIAATVLTIPVLAALAHRWGGRVAVAPTLLAWMSMVGVWSIALDVRGYAISTLLATVVVAAYVALLDGGARRRAAGVCVGVAGTVMVLVNILPLLLLLALAAHSVLRQRVREAGPALTIPLATGVGMWAWAISADTGQVDWIPPTRVDTLLDAFGPIVGSRPLIGVLGLLALTAATTLAVVVLLGLRGRASSGVAPGDALLVLLWGAGTPAALIAISFVRPLVIGRYFSFCLPGLALVLGVAVAAAWNAAAAGGPARTVVLRSGAAAMALGVLGVLALNLQAQPLRPYYSRYEDFSALARQIGEQARPGDALDYPGTGQLGVPTAYVLRREGGVAADLPVLGESTLRQPELMRSLVAPEVLVRRMAEHRGRLWLVSRITGPGDEVDPSPFGVAQADALRHRDLLDERRYGWLRVRLYSAPRG